ncbi:MAG: sigma-54-dependent Fis family transcriptional regulator [Proteobacteria bacterium]|nr:sigma-54-dependent Fis family transcriptional regulator [Pseudomonadota bacterium]NOG60224.1 sigma-54-dependent Fis family transcriptional regulator [Pseudomonadota bacterium]
MSKRQILVVDDEPDIRSLVQEILEDEGFSVNVAENATKARQEVESFKPDLILLDIWMPDIDGITLLKEWKEDGGITSPIIMMSGHGNVETAVEATRHGAYDFIEKPLSISKLLLTIKHAFETTSLQQENLQLRHTTSARLEPIGKSKVILNLRSQIARIAAHDTPVLIYGESGTDKELFARYLHSLSPRNDGPFITVSISALAKDHAEIELFGSKTNNQFQEGYFDKAKGGVLYIKDISELDKTLQSHLHDVLETKRYSHIGSSEQIELDMRIIAATRFDIETLIQENRFRDDLYYLLNVLPISIPPIRDHYEDVPAMLEYYVDYFIETEGLPYRKFDVAAQNRLRSYQWPGNVRELKNIVQRLLILGTDENINIDEVESCLGNSQKKDNSSTMEGFDFDLPLRDARESFEKAYLEYQLKKAKGSVSKVANTVGIERTHLYRKLKTLGIDLK